MHGCMGRLKDAGFSATLEKQCWRVCQYFQNSRLLQGCKMTPLNLSLQTDSTSKNKNLQSLEAQWTLAIAQVHIFLTLNLEDPLIYVQHPRYHCR